MFHEKERELASAVHKVDQLTRQLDELRKQKAVNGSSAPTSRNAQASNELEKLRKELVVSMNIIRDITKRCPKKWVMCSHVNHLHTDGFILGGGVSDH